MSKLITAGLVLTAVIFFFATERTNAEAFSPEDHFYDPNASIGINKYEDADAWLQYISSLRRGENYPSLCEKGPYCDLIDFYRQNVKTQQMQSNAEFMLQKAVEAQNEEALTSRFIEVAIYARLICADEQCFTTTLKDINAEQLIQLIANDCEVRPETGYDEMSLAFSDVFLTFSTCFDRTNYDEKINQLYLALQRVIDGYHASTGQL
ncbi:hypothetical protein [Celeribacter ethanolicus]|uniref:hypothetical protein n=1 Tax=Celeribacter ethanolicus TaxID=1758178 RepID=UPI00082B9125|nr:hypothetical protein [Celeribacter ethanolicus]